MPYFPSSLADPSRVGSVAAREKKPPHNCVPALCVNARMANLVAEYPNNLSIPLMKLHISKHFPNVARAPQLRVSVWTRGSCLPHLACQPGKMHLWVCASGERRYARTA